MLQNSVNLMVQLEFSEMNCLLSTNQLWLESSKNDWTKRLQKIPRKINVSLSLAETKLAEKK